MTHTIHKVKEFHQAFGHPVEQRLTPSTEKHRVLRVKLIAEELTELCSALGINLSISQWRGEWDVKVTPHVPSYVVDLVEVADALGDLDYVVQGSNLVFGIPAEAVLDEIHRSNMSKLGADGKPILREDGKVVKGPDYFKPNISKILKDYE